MCPSNFYKMNNEKKGDYPISTQKYNRRPVHIKNEDNYIITILQYIYIISQYRCVFYKHVLLSSATVKAQAL